MQNAQPVSLERLARALLLHYPESGIQEVPWEGGRDIKVIGVPGFTGTDSTLSVANGSGIDPGRVLLARLIGRHLLKLADVDVIEEPTDA